MTKQDELVLEDNHRAVTTARRFVAERLAQWGRQDAVDDAELCTSELVTNAILHAHTEARLRVRADDDAVRVEVHDGSRQLPARGRAGDDGMTGRGLLLVESVASAWGVEPHGDGKSVWFELSADPGDGAADVTAGELPRAWGVDEPAWLESAAPGPARFRVSLGDVPTALLLDATAHVDNLVREFALATAGAAAGTSSQPPEALAELIDSVVARYQAHLAIRAQAQIAVDQAATRVRLELDLPAAAATEGEAYLRALDEADQYCRAARLLTLESPPQFRVFREWYVEQIGRQLRAVSAGGTEVAQTFEARLLDELAATAAARRTAERNSRLQGLTAALANALTPERVARAVLEDGVRALEANAACFLVPGPGRGLCVLGSVGYDDDLLARLTSGDVSSLPSGVALETGTPVWIETREERDARFPQLAGLDGPTMSLCAVPLTVAGPVLGVLRFSFSAGRLFGADERGLVQALAAQAAQALDRARLYAEERAARQAAEAAAARLARLHSVGERWSTAARDTLAERDVAVERREVAARAAPPVEWASLAYQAVLDELSDGVVVADAGGTIRYVNRATERLLAAAPGELTALPLTELVPPRLRAAHLAGLSRYLATREPRLIGTAIRVPALRRDGIEVEVELTLGATPVTPGPTGVDGDLLLVASLREMGDRVALDRPDAAPTG